MHSERFHDYDAYTQAVERVDARFMVRNIETPGWQLAGVAMPQGITVQHCWSGSGLIVNGSGPARGAVLAVPAGGRFIADGEALSGDDALLIGPDSEFLVSMPGRHRCFDLFIPEPLLQRVGLQGRRERPQTGVIHTAARGKRSLATLLVRFMANATAIPEAASNPSALRSFERCLMNVIRDVYGAIPRQPGKTPGRQPTVDSKSIHRAIDLIEAAPGASLSMAELAGELCIPERTLRASFRKHLGLAPTQYMQLRLMHRARQRLTTSDPGQLTVARVAADLGVWDFGRFATRYRQLFGEPPSATLRAGLAA